MDGISSVGRDGNHPLEITTLGVTITTVETLTEQDLHQLFEPYNNIETIRIMTDRETGRSRGFRYHVPDVDAHGSSVCSASTSCVGCRPCHDFLTGMEACYTVLKHAPTGPSNEQRSNRYATCHQKPTLHQF